MIDCEKCVHFEDYEWCDECSNYDRTFHDCYEEATSEMIAEKREKDRLQAENNAIDQWVSVEIPEEFCKAFNLAKRFSAEEHSRRPFMGVYITPDGYLVASETHMLIEISCKSIPKQLLGQCVIKLKGNRAGIHTKQTFPSYKELFEIKNEHRLATMDKVRFSLPTLSENEAESYKHLDIEPESMIIAEFEALFQKEHLNLIREVLEGEKCVYYRPDNKFTSVIFTGSNAKILIIPLRICFDIC